MAPDDESLAGLSLAQVCVGLEAGRLSAVSLLERAIARHEATGGGYGAYAHWDPDAARTHASRLDRERRSGLVRSELHGVPMSVKDLYGVPGLPTCAGSSHPLPRRWSRAGRVVAATQEAGLLIAGKTQTVEFAFGGLGVNPVCGTPRNPWDPARVPGGSSSGAAVSVVAGSALFALGTDTAGSARIPASMTGIAGLAVTRGRWSLDGVVPLSSTLDRPGILAVTAADLATAFEVLDARIAARGRAGSARRGRVSRVSIHPRELRIGVVDEEPLWSACSPGVREVVETGVEKLRKAGAIVESVRLPGVSEAVELFLEGGLAAPELHRFLSRELPDWLPRLHPIVATRLERGAVCDDRELRDRRERWRALRGPACSAASARDALVLPTVPITAPRLAELSDARSYRRANLLALRNTCVANYLDLCALTLPAGLDAAGMPVGLQLLAPGGQDAHLLLASQAVERVLGPLPAH